jgi:hypothetical protein
MTTARPFPRTLRLAFCALAGALALGALAAGQARAATSASLDPTNKCWLAVINDWLDNGQVDRVYAIPCYTQAIQHLNQFSDVKGYSSAEDDIHNALLAAIRQDRGGGLGGGGGSPGTGPGGSDGGPSASGGGKNAGGQSFIAKVGDKIGPGNAQSIPLPLLVLGGLAVLLLLAALGTWIARRMQARRVTSAPAPAPRR